MEWKKKRKKGDYIMRGRKNIGLEEGERERREEDEKERKERKA